MEGIRKQNQKLKFRTFTIAISLEDKSYIQKIRITSNIISSVKILIY